MKIKTNVLNYKDPNTGEYVAVPVVVSGDSENVTAENIVEALGYTPANEEVVDELNEKLVQETGKLSEDIEHSVLGKTEIIDSFICSNNLISNYTEGKTYQYVIDEITLDAGEYLFVVFDSHFSSDGYICVYKDKVNGEVIVGSKKNNGKYLFTLPEQATIFLLMQVSLSEPVSIGKYNVRYSIYKNDSAIIPKEYTGVDAVEKEVDAVEKGVKIANNKINNFQKKIDFITDNVIKNLIDFDNITFNISDEYAGCFIGKNGIVQANQYSKDYCVTDYIPISKKGLIINYSVGNVYAALYDESGEYIGNSSIILEEDTVFVPYMDGAASARFSLKTAKMAYRQYCIVDGNKAYTLSPDEYFITPEFQNNLISSIPFSAIPPERLVIQNGKQSVLYMENMVKNTNNLPKISQNVLTNIGNLAYTTPLSDIADGSILYHFEDCLGRKIEESKKYSVVSVPNKELLNMLFVGDSFTDIGTYVGTVKDNITGDGISVSLIGNMGVEGRRHEARSGGTWDFVTTKQGRAIIVDVTSVSNSPTTGYPGTTYEDSNGFKWTVRGVNIDSDGNGKLILSTFNVDANYGGTSTGNTTDADSAADNIPTKGTLTKTSNATTGVVTSDGDNTIAYNGVEKIYYNPFWNPTSDEIDFTYYIEKWGYNTPDVIVFSIGYNDVGESEYHTVDSLSTIIGKAKIAVDRVHMDYPNSKIVLNVNPLGYGGESSNEITKAIRVNNQITYYEALINAFGESTDYASYVIVCPSFVFVDRVDAYNEKTITIGSRISKTITTATDRTHCNSKGMNQISDGMTPYIYYILQ